MEKWEKEHLDKEHRRQIGLWIIFIIFILILVNYNSSEHGLSQDQASGYSSE